MANVLSIIDEFPEPLGWGYDELCRYVRQRCSMPQLVLTYQEVIASDTMGELRFNILTSLETRSVRLPEPFIVTINKGGFKLRIEEFYSALGWLIADSELKNQDIWSLEVAKYHFPHQKAPPPTYVQLIWYSLDELEIGDPVLTTTLASLIPDIARGLRLTESQWQAIQDRCEHVAPLLRIYLQGSLPANEVYYAKVAAAPDKNDVMHSWLGGCEMCNPHRTWDPYDCDGDDTTDSPSNTCLLDHSDCSDSSCAIPATVPLHLHTVRQASSGAPMYFADPSQSNLPLEHSLMRQYYCSHGNVADAQWEPESQIDGTFPTAVPQVDTQAIDSAATWTSGMTHYRERM
ncbi:unnamed protein product [Somion occarium]|uniref:Uncharacterized protein n=1 Tax=Somion occarium TaxID=3059160 RepID=A0ABP1DMP6_9APHY